VISPETIALVRERTNIVAVITESVPSLKRKGRSWVGLCPFHKEKTGSFNVNPDRGFFHCFGCKESGSAIDFLMKHDGLTFPEAVRALADRCGIEVQEDQKRDTTEFDRVKKHKDDLLAVMNVAATFYERQLHEHADKAYAIEELEKRGLKPDQDVIQQFRIGYAPAAWDSLAQHLKAQGLSPALGEQVGLLVPRQGSSGHYDRFRHRLMFAVMDTQGRVVAFSGRALREITKEEGKDPPPKYVNSPESAVYTKGNLLFGLFQARHAIRQEDTAILVEGNFDVVSLHARGLQNVVAPLGTAFTDEQAKLLRRYSSQLVLCFDGDAAGRKAMRAARDPSRDAGVTVRVALMPHMFQQWRAEAGVDPDALARDKGIAAVKDAVAQSRGLVEFLLEDFLDASFNAADASEKSARVQGVAKLLADEDDPLQRAILKQRVDTLAGRLDLVRREDSARGNHSPEAFRALESAVKRIASSKREAAPKLRPGQVDAPPDRARFDTRKAGRKAMAQIVGALIEFPELLDDPHVAVGISLLTETAAMTVATLRSFASGSSLYATDFVAHLQDAGVREFAKQRIAAPQYETIDLAKADVEKAIERLRMVDDNRAIEDATQETRTSEWEEQTERAAELQKKLKERHGLK
jgi:DNA primase